MKLNGLRAEIEAGLWSWSKIKVERESGRGVKIHRGLNPRGYQKPTPINGANKSLSFPDLGLDFQNYYDAFKKWGNPNYNF